MQQLTRKQKLAAEVFGYSYDHYADHLGDSPSTGNQRFEELMPEDVDTLAQAEQENWDSPRLAKALEIDEDQVEEYQRLYRQARDIVDAPSPAESFRRSVRYSIENAVREGLRNESDVEQLVTQVCYRAADLGYLLDGAGKRLSAYSEELRAESSLDDTMEK